MNGMLIKLWTSDNEGLALVFAAVVEDAVKDVYINGNRWDFDGNNAAFAYVDDRPDLVAYLSSLGYEVDDRNYEFKQTQQEKRK